MTRRLHQWRQDDYNAYKFVRAVAGRRISGSAWVPVPGMLPQRLTNANREAALDWCVDMALPFVRDVLGTDSRVTVFIPVPGPGRVVGSPPSPSRALAAGLARHCEARLLDVLRWRQPLRQMPGGTRPVAAQTFSDNLTNTGGVIMADCVLVADAVFDVACLQAVAGRLRRLGGNPVLAISAGRAVEQLPDDPFAERTETIASFEPNDY